MFKNVTKQFEVYQIFDFYLFGYNIVFTNCSLFLLIALSLFVIIGLYAFRKSNVLIVCTNEKNFRVKIPDRFQLVVEELYGMISNMTSGSIGHAKAAKYIPAVFAIFMLILLVNLIGIIPSAFTPTSSIIVNFTIALTLFVAITLLGICIHGFHFFSLFLPPQTPVVLAPLLLVIEIFTYLSRPISLALRLTANVVAGHIILKVIAGIVLFSGLLGFMPLALLVLLNAFEIFVAALQAYIFAVLLCVYLNDAINLH